MKKILCGISVLSLLLLTIACSEKKEIGFTIKGTAGSNTKIKLKKYDATQTSLDVVDSIQVAKNGDFTLEGPKVSPSIMFLEFRETNGDFKNALPIYITEGEYTLVTDGDFPTIIKQDYDSLFNAIGQNLNANLIELNIARNALAQNIDTTKVADLEANLAKTENQYFRSLRTFVHFFDDLNAVDKNALIDYYSFVYPQALGIKPFANDNERVLGLKENVKKLEKVAIGQPYINIVGQTPSGEELSLAEIVKDKKVTLVDFWASWCPPCRRDMPFLVDLYAKYKDQGFEIAGISLDDDLNKWQTEGIEALNITWPQISDLKGWQSELSAPYVVVSIPHTILIDSNGIIVAKQLHGDELENKIKELL